MFNEALARNLTLKERAQYGYMLGNDEDFAELAEAQLCANIELSEAVEQLGLMLDDKRARIRKTELDGLYSKFVEAMYWLDQGY